MRLSIETYPGHPLDLCDLPAALTGHGIVVASFLLTRLPYDRLGDRARLHGDRAVELLHLLLRRAEDPAADRDRSVRSGRAARRNRQRRVAVAGAAAARGHRRLPRHRRRFRRRFARRMGGVPGRRGARRADRLPGQAIVGIADRAGRARPFVGKQLRLAAPGARLFPFEVARRFPVRGAAAAGRAAADGLGRAGHPRRGPGPGAVPPVAHRLRRHAHHRVQVPHHAPGFGRGRAARGDDRQGRRPHHPRRRVACAAPGSTSCRRSSTS